MELQLECEESAKSFEDIFSAENLYRIFIENIEGKKSAGIGGLTSERFAEDIRARVASISKKVLAGRYKYSPYVELERSKGRGKVPRILSLPTIRDQIVLSALKDYLHSLFEESVNRKLSSSQIFEINKKIQSEQNEDSNISFLSTDITGFYDNIDKELLMNIVRQKTDSPLVLKLVHQGINNLTVPYSSRRNERADCLAPTGIPQGVAISNILASVYLDNLDKVLQKSTHFYARYVDDIFIMSPECEMDKIFESLQKELGEIGLTINEVKTRRGLISKDPFEFIGYRFVSPAKITVRQSSFQRKISSLIALIATADHKRRKSLRVNENWDGENHKKVLIEDLNLQIAGAYSHKKQYGWLFYFSQINDLRLLHRLDRIVDKLCCRCSTLENKKPNSIKSFVTAYRAIHDLRRNRDRDYILNYDKISSDDKKGILARRGLINKDAIYSREVVEQFFKSYESKSIRNIEADLRDMS